MIIKSIIQNKDLYSVTIDDFQINLSEDLIVKYNLYVNKEIDDKAYNELTISIEYYNAYDKALKYSIKYNKSKRAVYNYLVNKNYSIYVSESVCNELVEKGIISDYNIAEGLAYSYYKKGNGRHLIKAKLEALLLSSDAIDKALSKIDFDDYITSMNKYAKKYYDKNSSLDPFMRLMKTKEFLKKHGYTYDEISYLEIEWVRYSFFLLEKIRVFIEKIHILKLKAYSYAKHAFLLYNIIA